MSVNPPPSTSDRPADRYMNMIRRTIASGQWERALEIARAWLAEDPHSVQAHLSAGQALVSLQQYPLARQHLQKSLQGNPHNAATHRLLSAACFHLNDHGKANEHIQQAIALDPSGANNWYHLALMRYKLGALADGAKHARRALELQPDDANTLNLLALCENQRGPARRDQYLRALALDPENEAVLINLGTYYLEVDRNYPAAEECVRRALTLDPANKMAQKNLFAVLRQRDPLYRALQFPRTLVGHLSWANNRHGALTRVALAFLAFSIGKILLGIVVLWLLFVYPLIKIYEYLTLGDLHARVGIPGARRGGLLGYKRWPFGVRFGLFAVLGATFWGGVFLACRNEINARVISAGLGIATLGFVGVYLAQIIKRHYRKGIAWRAERKFRRQQANSAAP